jgi:ABC-type sugar transport system substrate-binding protein
MKRIMLVVLIVCIALSAAFATGGAEKKPTGAPEKGYKVGMITFDLVNPYWVKLVQGARDKAAELGVELIVSDPGGDITKQVNALENFVAMGVNGIIVSTLDASATEAVLKDAQKKGIKVLAQSMDAPGSNVWVSAAEWDMGYTIGVEAGKWIKNKLKGEAEVLVLSYDRIPQIIARKEGIIAGIKEHAPNAKIVATQDANTIQKGMEVAETVLQAFPNIKVVAAVNDAGALGALAAIESAGKSSPELFVGGIDATDEALEKIKQGTTYRATVDIVPYENGKLDVDLIVKLLRGEKMDYKQPVPVKAVTQ